MRQGWLFLGLVAALVLTSACGASDDEGYCIAEYGDALATWGVAEFDGTACVWADERSCVDAGGDWVDYNDTEFDFSGNDNPEASILPYCESEGFPVECAEFLGEGNAEMYCAE